MPQPSNLLTNNNSNDLNEIKATMYADDTGGIVKNLKSVEYFFEEFKKWGKVSGASMNEDKTKILGINSCYEKFRNINFVENLKMLGITFDKKGISSINLENCKKKLKIL
jgi:hypothetical protein